MLILALIVGGVGIFTMNRILENDANRMINLLSDVQKEELNLLLKGVEQSVQIMEKQCHSNLESVEKLIQAKDYRAEYTELL